MDGNVFTYGSLMFAPVWSRVVTRRYRSQPARLVGYVRKKVRHQEYPAVVPAGDDTEIAGVLYLDIASADLDRLDRFEGPCYCRQRELLLLADGSRTPGWVYVFREAFRDRLESRGWDPRQFRRHGLKRFLAAYEGFRRFRSR